MQSGEVRWTSDYTASQHGLICDELRSIAVDICRLYKLDVPDALVLDKHRETKPVEDSAVTLDSVFKLADKIRDYLPGEAMRVESAVKYGDYYYFIHGMGLGRGEESGIVVRAEFIRNGVSRNNATFSLASPVAILYETYGVCRTIASAIDVVDFTGMVKEEFDKYIQGWCR